MPSWNELLNIEHWAREKIKKQIQADFLSALRRSASAYSTKTICAKNIMSTAADTLACYQVTQQQKRALKRAKKKYAALNTNASK